MSIKIKDNKLIIEINCGNQKPLATLAEYQEGLISMLHIANVNPEDNPPEEIQNAMYFTTNLLNQMMVSHDQQNILNKALGKAQEEEFNYWIE